MATACVGAWAGGAWLYAPHVGWLTLAIVLPIAFLIAASSARASEDRNTFLNGQRYAAIAVVNVVACAAALWSSHAVWLYGPVLAVFFTAALRLSVELGRDRAAGRNLGALISSAVGWTMRGLVISFAERLRRSGLPRALLSRGRPRRPYAYEHVRRVMVVSHSYIGDAVMQTPAIALIAKALPSARIVVLTNGATDGVFRDNPFVHERIRCLPPHGEYPTFAGLRRLVRLRREEPTLCVLDFNASQTLGIWFAWMAGPGYVIADGMAAADCAFLVDEIVPTSDLSHHVERNAAVVCRSSLGVAHGLSGVPDLTPILARDAPEVSAAAATLRQLRIADGARLVGFIVGSAGGFATSKRWPVERFAALARQLKTKVADVEILAFKGPQELDVDYGALQEAGCRIVEGKTLLEIAGLIARCDAIVGNDSGLGHVSACMGTSAVTIFGPTDWKLVKPYSRVSLAVRQEGCPPCFGSGQELVKCRGERPCIVGVTVEQVANATLGMLGQALPNNHSSRISR